MALTGAVKIGKARKLYVDVDGNISSPTWVEAGKIQGARRSGSRNLAEIEERDVDEVTVIPGHKNNEFSFDLTFRPGNTTFDAIQDAFEGGTKIGLAFMSGPIATVGERGWQGECYVTGWDEDAAHTNSAVAITVRPAADYATAPAFVEIAE